MTNKEKVQTYVALHTEPVQKSIPEFYQKWTTPYGAEYWRSSTCERSFWEPHNCAIVKAPANNWVETAYIHYIPEFDMLEFSVVAINNVGRHKAYDTYRWQYTKERIFLIKGDVNPYNEKGELIWSESGRRFYNPVFIEYINGLKRFYYYSYENPQIEEMKKFCECETPLNLSGFKKQYTDYMAARNGEDDLPEPQMDTCQIVTEYIKKDIASFEKKQGHSGKSNSLTTAYCERISDAYTVIRYIRAELAFDNITAMSTDEFQRIYISKYGAISLKRHFGAWRKDNSDFPIIDICNKQDILQCNKVAHIYDIALELSGGKENSRTLVTLINHPVLECMYKAGYRKFAKYLLAHVSPSQFKAVFGMDEKKKGSIYQITGCNKWMLQAIENCETGLYPEIGSALKIYRQLFGTDVTHFSKDKIEKYLLAFIALSQCARIKCLEWNEILTGHRILREEDKAVIDRFVKIYNGGDHDIFDVLADIIRIYSDLDLDYSDAVVRTLRSSRDIYELHDRVTAQLNEMRMDVIARRVERERISLSKAFDSRQEQRRKRFNYENNSYFIRVPESLDEIAEEGSKLHHCVRSYINQHATGETNILFLRRKACPDHPYYTIEVKGGRVLQIHGFANKWLGNSPDAVGFVYEWVQKLGLSCEREILLCRAKGYSGDGEMLDESYLYRRALPDIRPA